MWHFPPHANASVKLISYIVLRNRSLLCPHFHLLVIYFMSLYVAAGKQTTTSLYPNPCLPAFIHLPSTFRPRCTLWLMLCTYCISCISVCNYCTVIAHNVFHMWLLHCTTVAFSSWLSESFRNFWGVQEWTWASCWLGSILICLHRYFKVC